MMVPQMQSKLLGAVTQAVQNAKSVYEPFVGSGTVMTESMNKGLDFVGQDINPLAVLLCRSKSGPFYDEAIKERTEELKDRILNDGRTGIEADFPNLAKWFRDDVAVELSKIRRAIRKERYLWGRRFYWIALAETVRLTSNSRTTTFKLHIRPADEIKKRPLSPIKIFGGILARNLASLSSQKLFLQEKGLLRKGRYTGSVIIYLRDSASPAAQQNDKVLYDLLVTSPPYGDNQTTIPYGQNSYLPLQWIDLEDIDSELDRTWLASTYEIDKRSLGGRIKHVTEDTIRLLDTSPSFKHTFEDLRDEPEDRRLRVAAFCYDLSRCIAPALSALKDNAYMIWTIGNRSVAGRPVPMDKILGEFLQASGAKMVDSIQRNIPSKRMALKNNLTTTMRSETTLIMRKAAANGGSR
jgi:hypothetical protein